MERNVPKIIPATERHIPLIADSIRPADRDELAAMGRTPEAALRDSLRVSARAWTGTVDDVPICMFGVAPTSFSTPDIGRPWMIGTELLDKYATIFLRRCRPQVAEMLRIFPNLENYVAAANIRAIEWLRWMGFHIEAPVPCGWKRHSFHRFELRRGSEMFEIRACTYDEVESSGLLDLYAEECAIDGLPRPASDPEKYRAMLGAGSMKAIGCFQMGALIGFITVMIVPLPHYEARCMAATESIFIHPDHREGGTWNRLFKAAESLAVENGAIGLMVSAPAGGTLAKVLRGKKNYRLSNEVFIRGFQ